MPKSNKNIKNPKLYFYIFIISVLSVSSVVLFTLLVKMASTAESLAVSLVDKTTDEAKNKLDNYFINVKRSIITTKQLCDQGILDAVENENLNSYYLPILNTYPEVSTIVLANTDGIEYSIIREDTSWLSNTVYPSLDSGMVIKRERWFGNIFEKNVIKNWVDFNSSYDPRIRPWFVGAVQNEAIKEPWWTEPYFFFTCSQPGITASMLSYNPISNKKQVILYDILLSEISDYTISEHESKHSKTFIMTNDLKMIGLPYEERFNNPDSIANYVLKPYDSINSNTLKVSVNEWLKYGKEYSQAFCIEIEGEKWWVKISSFNLSKNRSFLVGVAVPENDFLAEVNSTRNVVIGGFLIVLIIIIIVIRQYMMKQKVNQVLSKQKKEISMQRDELHHQHEIVTEQKKEITDSITYAKRIQSAILPPIETVNNQLKKSFVLYKPKDIVAGDFFWTHSIDNKVLFAVADCTGHGVPGALVSVICVNALNRSVREYGLSEPGKLLDKTKEIVISIFEKSKEEVKDGMDIALCSLEYLNLDSAAIDGMNDNSDQSNKETVAHLAYAGANNPLWIIRNGAVIETKADKQPIGKTDGLQLYKTHYIDLEKNDLVYIFSDGFVDQFGGEKGKKLKTKAFRELLLSIQDRPMKEQKSIIDTAFETWRGNLEQVDDVCVIGVRI